MCYSANCNMFNKSYIILLVIIYLRNGSAKESVHIKIDKNLISSLYPKNNEKSANVIYNTGDTLLVTCSVSNDIYKYRTEDYRLSLSKDKIEIESTSSEFVIRSTQFLLKDSDDDIEFICRAVSNNKTWSFSINLIGNVTEHHRSETSSTFSILLFSLGGFMAVSIVSLLCYSAIRCLRKNKSSKENGFDDVPLETKDNLYAEIDFSKKKAKPPMESDEPLYAETGFVNQSCDIQENDSSTLSNVNNDSCQIQDRRDNDHISLQKNDCQTKEYDQIKVYANGRNGSSTDC